MNIFYVSLVRGLVGYYVKFIADDEGIVRLHCNEYFKRLWCSVYDENTFEKMGIAKKNVINDDNPIVLGSHWEWE